MTHTGWIGPIGYGYAYSRRSNWSVICHPFRNGRGYGFAINLGRFACGLCIAF